MSIKVFQANSNGKIEFTLCELEKLLNDTFNEGYANGRARSASTKKVEEKPTIVTEEKIQPTPKNIQGGDRAIVNYPLDIDSMAKMIDEILNNPPEYPKAMYKNDAFNNLAKELRGL